MCKTRKRFRSVYKGVALNISAITTHFIGRIKSAVLHGAVAKKCIKLYRVRHAVNYEHVIENYVSHSVNCRLIYIIKLFQF